MLLMQLVVVASRGASKPSRICTYSVAVGPKLPSLVLLVIHAFPLHSLAFSHPGAESSFAYPHSSPSVCCDLEARVQEC